MALETPVRAHLPRQSAAARVAHAAHAPVQAARCPGAAAQLAAVHRTLRHGPTFQLKAGGSAAAANPTGLPDRLKAGVEALSGVSLDGVKVHYNSSKPAQLNALAYARGSDIHLAPGREAHLPHETWHVVQQAQGRVRPTMQMKEGVPVNDDAGLEREADHMGGRAMAAGMAMLHPLPTLPPLPAARAPRGLLDSTVAQREPEGDEEEGTRIKVWNPDTEEIMECFYSGDRKEKAEIGYTVNKVTNKKQKEPIIWTKRQYIFPQNFNNGQIKREIKQQEEMSAQLDESGLKISKEIVDYVKAELVKYLESTGGELGVQLDNDRIKWAIGQTEAIRELFRGAKCELDEFRESFEAGSDYYLGEILDSLGRTGTSSQSSSGGGSEGGGGGNEEWKSKQTERLKGALLGRISEKKRAEIVLFESSLHHKTSRSRFGRMLELLNQTPGEVDGVQDVWQFIKDIMFITRTSDAEKALDNWTANIELGPKVERRAPGDDPSEGFDGNFPKGVATPRTAELQEVDLIVASAAAGKDVPWAIVAANLRQTQIYHAHMTDMAKLGPGEFTDPILEQWSGGPDDFTRDKPDKAASSRAQTVRREARVDLDILNSVTAFLRERGFDPGRPVLVVSGKEWHCYIRCVLHHFSRIGDYDAVVAELNRLQVSLNSGLEVGGADEIKVITAIAAIVGKQFYVRAIDAAHGEIAESAQQDGERVDLLLTGRHFSLLQ